MTQFSHLWDFEPTSNNHWVPNYGLFSQLYFSQQLKSNFKEGKKYNSFNKDHGPPHWKISARYDPIEKNEYLLGKGVDIDALVAK